MPFLDRPRKKRTGAATALFTLMLPVFLIPLTGLAIDGCMLFIVQAKLSSAVDGAALGAGRLLGTTANINEIAGEFLRANFPTGFWGSRNLQPQISTTRELATFTIRVSATVDVPLRLMPVLGFHASTVGANAIVRRRDTRLMLVLDRSGSMNTTDPVSHLNVFTTMKDSAKQFVGMFTPGTDEIGLVVFSGSAIVAYPTTRPYDPSPTSGGGPDTSFGTSPTAGPIVTQINALNAGGGTNISEALALAYIELQKAHNRTLNNTGVDNSLNAIVLFTDGAPSAFTASPNSNDNLPTSNALKSTSPCTYNPADADPDHKMRGYFVVLGNGLDNSWSSPTGLHRLSAYDSGGTHTLNWWLQNPSGDYQVTSQPSNAIANCSKLGRGGVFNSLDSDLAKIPPTDYYGTSTSPNAGIPGYTLSQVYNGTNYDQTRVTTGYHMGLAGWNVTDNTGKKLRTQTGMHQIVIYTIGYTGNGGVDSVLLKRLANTLDSTSYVAVGEEAGRYYEVHTADHLAAAFNEVASELLRLAYR